ncbi:hypothetical protein [Brevibacillus migulae]|uniref:hypothetical protein n=1 Tax=Brevibacillus migulae TaxID=1644114 RepID=UPI00106E869A|nr:hypothetical protein [Brevibacillus migulae]
MAVAKAWKTWLRQVFGGAFFQKEKSSQPFSCQTDLQRVARQAGTYQEVPFGLGTVSPPDGKLCVTPFY